MFLVLTLAHCLKVVERFIEVWSTNALRTLPILENPLVIWHQTLKQQPDILVEIFEM